MKKVLLLLIVIEGQFRRSALEGARSSKEEQNIVEVELEILVGLSILESKRACPPAGTFTAQRQPLGRLFLDDILELVVNIESFEVLECLFG